MAKKAEHLAKFTVSHPVTLICCLVTFILRQGSKNVLASVIEITF